MKRENPIAERRESAIRRLRARLWRAGTWILHFRRAILAGDFHAAEMFAWKAINESQAASTAWAVADYVCCIEINYEDLKMAYRMTKEAQNFLMR